MNDWRWPDARGWIGLGAFFLTVMVLWMLAVFPDLRQDEFFKTIATLIIGTGFINGVVSWAYSATKSGGELADRNAALVERQTDTAASVAALAADNRSVRVDPPATMTETKTTVIEPGRASLDPDDATYGTRDVPEKPSWQV